MQGNAILSFPVAFDVERYDGTRGAQSCTDNSNKVSDSKLAIPDNDNYNFWSRIRVILFFVVVLILILLIIGGAQALINALL